MYETITYVKYLIFKKRVIGFCSSEFYMTINAEIIVIYVYEYYKLTGAIKVFFSEKFRQVGLDDVIPDHAYLLL